MYSLLAPQRARSSTGSIVQVVNRHLVEYVEPDRRAVVEVEFGRPISVYAHTLKEWVYTDGTQLMTPDEVLLVLSEIRAGLQAMGSEVEIV